MFYRNFGALAATAVALSGLALAQQGGAGGAAGGAGGTTPTNPSTGTPPGGGGAGGGGGIGNGGRGGGGQPTTPTVPEPRQEIQRPLFVSGTVVMSDGTEPPERVTIERVCGAGAVRPEGYTDSKGRFSFQLGANQGAFADASTGFFNAGDPLGNQLANFGLSSSTQSTSFPNAENAFWVCELRGKLPGYRSTAVSLAGKRYMDNPDVGRIVLTPMVKTEGLTESATASLAPKDARKAYEKGEEAARKGKFEQAEKELRKAVDLYPKHAPAWYELGKVAQAQNRLNDAREAYAKSIEADSKFVRPYVELYRLAFKQEDWEAVAKHTAELIGLNPYEFPDAFYYSGVAHLQMRQYEQAEESMREAVKADWRKENPKIYYVLGVILANRNKLQDAADSLNTFLKVAPENDTAIEPAKDLLARVDRAIAGNQPQQ